MPFASFEKNEKEKNLCSTRINDCQDFRVPMKCASMKTKRSVTKKRAVKYTKVKQNYGD